MNDLKNVQFDAPSKQLHKSLDLLISKYGTVWVYLLLNTVITLSYKATLRLFVSK